MELSARIANITPSLTLAIDSKAKALRAEGIDVCNFAGGEPDFDTPDHIKLAAIRAVENNFTRYTAVAGIPELREAIARKFVTENQLDYRPEEIIVSNGAKQSCFNAIMACVGPGDEVIIPAPYWISYPDMVRLAGAEPIIVPTTAANNWKITAQDFENAMSPRTKMIIINSPGNPTGAVYTKEELRAIAEVAADEEIFILSDEIYEGLIYDDLKHVSIASVTPEARDLTITVNGFSKSYAMTGWRLGYLGAPKKITQAIEALQSHSSSHACSVAQYAALAALEMSQQCVADMREEFNIRREYTFDRLTKMPQITTIKPSGAFYMLVDISKLGMSSMNFADRLLSKANVAVVPGIAFGNDKTIRLSYATGMDMIKEGLDRLENFCKTL